MDWKAKLKNFIVTDQPLSEQITVEQITAEKAETVIKDFLELVIQARPQNSFNTEQIKKADLETQDLLHEIELTTFNAYKGYVLARELKKVRLDRRYYKNENELLDYVVTFLTNNEYLKRDLKNLSEAIMQRKQVQVTRSYSPRVRDDLTCAGGHADV